MIPLIFLFFSCIRWYFSCATGEHILWCHWGTLLNEVEHIDMAVRSNPGIRTTLTHNWEVPILHVCTYGSRISFSYYHGKTAFFVSRYLRTLLFIRCPTWTEQWKRNWCINWVLMGVIDAVKETIADVSSVSPSSDRREWKRVAISTERKQEGYETWGTKSARFSELLHVAERDFDLTSEICSWY